MNDNTPWAVKLQYLEKTPDTWVDLPGQIAFSAIRAMRRLGIEVDAEEIPFYRIDNGYPRYTVKVRLPAGVTLPRSHSVGRPAGVPNLKTRVDDLELRVIALENRP